MNVLVSPAEPRKMKTLGASSPLPERYGMDVMWSSPSLGTCGVQRKEIRDLVSSLGDGRLAKELGQMNGVEGIKALLVEGRGSWTNDGWFVDRYVKFHQKALVGVLASVQNRGVWCFQTKDVDETKKWIRWLMDWSNKERHDGLMSRPGPMWTSTKDWQVHLLTSLPGVGVKRAEAILDHLGMPLRLSVSKEQLLSVPGLGKGTVETIMGVFPHVTLVK